MALTDELKAALAGADAPLQLIPIGQLAAALLIRHFGDGTQSPLSSAT